MIYCSHCGTQNREGSKYCGNCGARLAPPSGVVCPMCGTANKVESVFCNHCGARLVPLTAAPEAPAAPPIKGLSLPAKPPAPIPEEQPPAAPVPGESETPDWLARLRAAPPTEEPPSVPPSQIERKEEVGAPEWIPQLAAEEPEEAAVTEEISPRAEEEEPSWVRRLRGAARAEEAPTAPTAEEEEPTWVRRLRAAPPAEEPVVPTPTVAETVEEEIPDWLKEIRAEPAAKAEPVPEVEKPKPVEPPIESLEAVASAAPAARLAEETQLPAWLTAAPEKPSEIEELPDWLRLAMPAEEVVEGLRPEAAEGAVEAPIPAARPAIEPARPEEMPAWVTALKPTETLPPPLPAEYAGEPMETTGLLAGLRAVLPLAAAIAAPHALPKPAPQIERKDGARLFDAILAAPVAEPEAAAPKPARRVWTMRPLVYLLLALAVIIPFLMPFHLAGATVRITHTPAAEFYDVLQNLPSHSTVLLAFDYDPSAAGEMDLQATAIVRHLIQRRVRIIALSTLETGPQIAQRILNATTATSADYRYGEDYLNLGYLPGHEAGLAQLATGGLPANAKDFVKSQEVGQFPIAANVKNLRDLALVIELAGSEEPLKMWLEQVQARANVRVVAGVSAAVEPKARAYRDAKQLVAMVSGLVGAAQYEVLTNQPGLALTSVNAQSAAQLVLVFIVVLGSLVHWISRARGKGL